MKKKTGRRAFLAFWVDQILTGSDEWRAKEEFKELFICAWGWITG